MGENYFSLNWDRIFWGVGSELLRQPNSTTEMPKCDACLFSAFQQRHRRCRREAAQLSPRLLLGSVGADARLSARERRERRVPSLRGRDRTLLPLCDARALPGHHRCRLLKKKRRWGGIDLVFRSPFFFEGNETKEKIFIPFNHELGACLQCCWLQ